MSPRFLKRLRVAVAVVFLAPTALLFLDFRDTGARHLAEGVLYLQFVPSMLRFLGGATSGAAGCLIVLGLTLLFGRVYCSTVCPFGALQDALARLPGGKGPGPGKRRPRFSFARAHGVLRYATLLLAVLLFLGSSGLLLNLLDPFSNFGRIFTTLARPAVLAANNLAAPVAERLGILALYRVPWPETSPAAVGAALVVLLAVAWAAARRGRLYCNTLCPVGTLLGMVSRHAPFRVRLDPDACRGCGLCARVCKAECIDHAARTLDASRCVNCYNCLEACPEGALRLGPGSGRPRPVQGRPGRRRFLAALAVAGLGVTAGKSVAQTAQAVPPPLQSRPTTIPEARTSPVSPPGSQSVARFTARCTACHLCVAACPAQVLVPAFLDYGLSGLLQPQMSFRSAHCNFDCTLCSEICPSGAIAPLDRERKQRTQVGVAAFIRENCVVYTDNTNCGACSEHCPTKAVRMVPYLDMAGHRLVIPEVRPALCVGCGACEHACPTRPYRAIAVNGNPVHALADKPEEEAPLPEPAATEDFPF